MDDETQTVTLSFSTFLFTNSHSVCVCISDVCASGLCERDETEAEKNPEASTVL